MPCGPNLACSINTLIPILGHVRLLIGLCNGQAWLMVGGRGTHGCGQHFTHLPLPLEVCD